MAHDDVRDNPYTRGIAQFVAGLTYDDIPADVRQRIKLLILDSLGCGLYGVDLEWTQIILKTLQSVEHTDDGCRVWGTDQSLSAPHAALINGSFFNACATRSFSRAAFMPMPHWKLSQWAQEQSPSFSQCLPSSNSAMSLSSR